ncbi:hypothetical protein Poli38472_005132 [Pythium oligandrum]|uniref:Uncharacterized protein n=1 Tax=Pythium oligandrum TaxID=41045 RepID=A0A8K1CFH8_PYTOL|nr:hypothetical protein Poli38472_005132 [Pythium oligandrum]|eukprot:TMW62514.1 hypothetical protein Poli38472_005132 [Pythium oligandrum]
MARRVAFSPLDLSDTFKEYYYSQRDPATAPRTTPLHTAVLNGELDRTKRLLATGKVEASAKDASGYTALHHACLLRRHDLVSILLTHGADVNVAASDGNTPLHKAAQGGDLRVVQVLVNAGTDSFTANMHGATAVDESARRKHSEVTALLRQLMLK